LWGCSVGYLVIDLWGFGWFLGFCGSVRFWVFWEVWLDWCVEFCLVGFGGVVCVLWVGGLCEVFNLIGLFCCFCWVCFWVVVWWRRCWGGWFLNFWLFRSFVFLCGYVLVFVLWRVCGLWVCVCCFWVGGRVALVFFFFCGSCLWGLECGLGVCWLRVFFFFLVVVVGWFWFWLNLRLLFVVEGFVIMGFWCFVVWLVGGWFGMLVFSCVVFSWLFCVYVFCFVGFFGILGIELMRV